MNIPYVIKRCSCCGEWLVASTVNFYKQKYSKDGLNNKCKKCRCDYGKKRREENRKIREKRSDDYKAKTKEQRLEFSKRHKEKNDKNRKKRKAQYDRIVKYEYRKQYYENNKEKILEKSKQYYQNNKDKFNEYSKQYRQSPQGQVVVFNRNQKRRTREERQGSGITKDQWLEMMKFFNWRCAYSGEYLGGEDNLNRTIDHIIPISKNGPHEIWNLVPMARSLNCSKNNKNMLTWYKSQECFNRERLDKIYQWQEYAFNKYYLEGEE